jgi:Protein of unknown function (DUF1501)
MNGCADFWRTQRMSRRAMLRAGGVSILGLTLPGLLRAETEASAAPTARRVAGEGRPTARSVILLFNFGGASHLETFDMKPDGTAESRGEFRPIPTNVPGIRICELLPRMARMADKYAIIRSVHHKMGNHNAAAYTGLTGFMPARDDINLRDSPEQMPAYGSVVSRFRPAENGMPSFVAMPTIIRDATQSPGQHGGYLGKQHDPLLILRDPNNPDFQLPELSLPEHVSVERLQDRRSLLKLLDGQSRRAELAAAQGLDTYQERAFSMLCSPQVKAAFDLQQEPVKLRDEYGRTTFGQCCLLARRLVEQGVRLVTVFYSQPSGGFIWDTHKDHFSINKKTLLPVTDQAVPALLNDLDQRGLLDETLVVWTGEFGRTPKVNKDAGRDHWPHAYSVVMAGGGIRGGMVYGATDENGAYPIENPVSPANVSGTLYHALGIDPHTEIRDRLSRPYPIAEDPIRELLG